MEVGEGLICIVSVSPSTLGEDREGLICIVGCVSPTTLGGVGGGGACLHHPRSVSLYLE